MEKRVKLSIFLILCGTLSGLSIGFYKGFTSAYTGSFPYMQVKGIKRWIKPLSKRLTLKKNSRVESYNYVSNDFSYPHLGADKVSFNKIVTQLGFEKNYDIEMGLDEMIEKINEDDSLLDYEDKVYSNFSQLKDSFSES